MYKRILFIFSVLNCALANAQLKDTSIFRFPIQMDEIVVSAVKAGWDVNAFIKRVKEDTSFYKAFKSMRLTDYLAEHDIRVLNDDGKIKAYYHSKTRQSYRNGCRIMDVLEERTSEGFYKRKNVFRYYTAELYASLFFTEGKVCNETDIVKGTLKPQGRSQIEKSKYRLKLLMFNPGAKVPGVPLMGDKAQLFEPDIAKMYNFKLSIEKYADEDCYVFSAVPKEEYRDEVVYDLFTTWFRKTDYAILQRNYSLSYDVNIYDFDVKMKVKMTEEKGKLLPSFISYDGNWHVFTKKRERVRFTTYIYYSEN